MAELTYEAAFPGRFIKAALLDGKPVTLTIARIYQEGLEGEKGKETKLIASFKERPMELVLCKTNALCMKEMWGSKVSGWIDRKLTMFPTRVQFGPKQVDAIRVAGSPDIAADIQVTARIGRKVFSTILRKTASGRHTAPAPQQPEPPTDAPDPADFAFAYNPEADGQ